MRNANAISFREIGKATSPAGKEVSRRATVHDATMGHVWSVMKTYFVPVSLGPDGGRACALLRWRPGLHSSVSRSVVPVKLIECANGDSGGVTVGRVEVARGNVPAASQLVHTEGGCNRKVG